MTHGEQLKDTILASTQPRIDEYEFQEQWLNTKHDIQVDFQEMYEDLHLVGSSLPRLNSMGPLS